VPNAALLRVGIDTGLGGVWGPITSETRPGESCGFEFIPFPAYKNCSDENLESTAKVESYSEITGINTGRKLSDFLPKDYLHIKDKSKRTSERWYSPKDIVPHYDPNFRHVTFADYWSSEGGRLPKAWRTLRSDEIRDLYIIFFATLARFPGNLSFDEFFEKQRFACGDYLIGSMRIRRFIPIGKNGWKSALDLYPEEKDALIHNFHYNQRIDPKEPVVVIGDRDHTCLAKKAIPLRVRTGPKTWRPLGIGSDLKLSIKAPLRKIKYQYDLGFVQKIMNELHG